MFNKWKTLGHVNANGLLISVFCFGIQKSSMITAMTSDQGNARVRTDSHQISPVSSDERPENEQN
jgi:hypothetical protein